MVDPCDASAFTGEAFSPKAWLNQALQTPSEADDEPLELRLSVLLTKLHLSAADVDAEATR